MPCSLSRWDELISQAVAKIGKKLANKLGNRIEKHQKIQKIEEVEENKYFIGNYGPREICIEKAQGVYLQDTNSKSYLDFSGAIAVNAFGYSHPILIDALKKQADKLWHSSNLWLNNPSVDLARELVERTFADKVFLCNSGLEANEAALKLARKRGNEIDPNKNRIICFTGAFHGRSLFTLSLGGKEEHRIYYQPLPQGISRAPFNDPDALAEAMDDDVCAIIVEPVQGEGGVTPASTELLEAARSLCDKHNALLIFDEVQSGMGRTGYLYNYMKHQVTPDVLSSAKGLGSGFPIGAILASEAAAASFSPGNHGSTFGGNALAASVAVEVLAMIDEDFLSAVREKGEVLREGLERIDSKRQCFKEVRGTGLLVGAQLQETCDAKFIRDECRRQGLLILLAGAGDVLRIAPPLIISKAEIEEGISILENVMSSCPCKKA